MTRQDVLDAYFMESRARLLDLAAFIDRLERAEGPADFRWANFKDCLPLLLDAQPAKTRRMLERLSDPTETPVAKAPGKGASGAWPEYPPEKN